MPLAAADWMQIRIGQAATWFPTPDDILPVAHRRWSEWRDKILRLFTREFPRWTAGTILATQCQLLAAQASLPVGGAAPG
jgi:hypothetical protein